MKKEKIDLQALRKEIQEKICLYNTNSKKEELGLATAKITSFDCFVELTNYELYKKHLKMYLFDTIKDKYNRKLMKLIANGNKAIKHIDLMTYDEKLTILTNFELEYKNDYNKATEYVYSKINEYMETSNNKEILKMKEKYNIKNIIKETYSALEEGILEMDIEPLNSKIYWKTSSWYC